MLALVVASCTSGGSTESLRSSGSSQGNASSLSSVSANQLDNSIRKIDFGNYTYEWYSDLSFNVNGSKVISLKDGKVDYDLSGKEENSIGWASLGGVFYGDLGVDGLEDAVVVLLIGSGTNGVHNLILVYSMHAGKPSLVFTQEVGGSAGRSMRNAVISDGFLNIELYNLEQLCPICKPLI
jgi:hypothetical protein